MAVIKIYNGSSWLTGNVKHRGSAAWIDHETKFYNGSAWISLEADPVVDPTVSASAPGDSNTSAFSARYVGVKFDTDGEEYLLSGSSSSNFDSTLGTWLDTGLSDAVWVEFIRTAGSDTWLGKVLSTRYNINVDQLFYGRDLNVGSDSFSITGYFRFWDAASGGNILQTTSTQLWYARYFNACPTCCFTPETLITMHDGSEMPIGKIDESMQIMVFNPEENANEPQKVSEIITVEERAMNRLYFGDHYIDASDDHPFATFNKGPACTMPQGEYKNFGVPAKLEVGDLIHSGIGLLKLTAIETIEYPGTVYTFENSLFYANGLLVY